MNAGAGIFIYPPKADLVQHANGAGAARTSVAARLIRNVRRTIEERMARTFTAVLLVILATYGSVLSQGITPQDDALATVQTFVRANETANLELIVSTFDDAATVFFPGDRPQRASGKTEIREVFGELFKQRKGPITITPRDVSVQLLGDVAIVTAHLRALPATPVREPTVFPRRTFVLRRVEGRWLIVHHHASNFVLGPPP
jgi:uncharacterized protein (TIGR02246 family)